MNKKIILGLVAYEDSADNIAYDMILALKNLYSDYVFEIYGIFGHKVRSLGYQEFANAEFLKIMGFIEPIKNLWKILSFRKRLYKFFLKKNINIFIGVDAPDFNLKLELLLKNQGIKTIHYVSPSIWAWRFKRIFYIQKACDLVLCLFPFEQKMYEKYNIQSHFVGHPLTKEIKKITSMTQLQCNKIHAREKLSLKQQDKIIAIMCGSRLKEIKYLTHIFLDTMCLILQEISVKFLLPITDNIIYNNILIIIKQHSQCDLLLNNLRFIMQDSLTAMQASDAILATSGTVTLEAMLLVKPLIVAYKLNSVIYFLLKKIVKIKYIALPNILAKKIVVKEFLQQDVTAKILSIELINILQKDMKISQFTELCKLNKQLEIKDKNLVANLIMHLIKK